MRILTFIFLFFSSLPALTADQNDLTPLQKDWWVNPMAKDNPLFYGGPELFLSSRMGQVYLPGIGVSVFRPFYLFASESMSLPLLKRLEGLTVDQVAHLSWRLGCDQGYLGAKELKYNNFQSLNEYFLGSRDNTSTHPSLSSHLNQTITPMALLLFGAGQVLGQRYVGPYIGKKLNALPFFQTKMSVNSSQTFMDVYGWPSIGNQFARSDAVAKISGILVGTYLGWSLNDFGWQLVNWRKTSTDSFSEYTPAFGAEDWGSINKGWGTLGFTIGGMLGHNIGASLASKAVSKYEFKSGKTLSKIPRTGAIHSTAIAGNLIIGLSLTTYFPHLYKTIFNQFDRPQETTGLRPLSELSPKEQEQEIARFTEESLQGTWSRFFSTQEATWSSSTLKKELLMKILRSLPKEERKKISMKELVIINKNEMEADFTFQLKMTMILKQTSTLMQKQMGLFLDEINTKLRSIKRLSELKSLVHAELPLLLPDDFFLPGQKKQTIEKLLETFQSADSLDQYKKRFYEFIIFIYPSLYKVSFSKKMERLSTTYDQTDDPILSTLFYKRDLLTLQIKSLQKSHPAKAKILQNKFFVLNSKLVQPDKSYYEKAGPQLLKNYNNQLDKLLKEAN